MQTVDLTYDQKAEVEIFADLCRSSFWHFLLYGFGVQNYLEARPDNPWLVERVHRPLAEWFEDRCKIWLRDRALIKVPTKLMIIWPRGFGKTTMITKAGQLWLHLQDPDIATVIDSVTSEKSWEFLAAVKDVMSGADPHAWFTQMYGDWRSNKRIWKTSRIVHGMRHSLARSEASIETSSVEKGLTGKHPDAIFIDDPVVAEKLTDELNWLDKVNIHVNALIPALKTDGLLVATATRYHDSDWLGKYIQEEGVFETHGMMPRDPMFKMKAGGQWSLYMLRARTDSGKPTLPEVYGEEALKRYEQKSPMDFAAQMMNEPGAGEHMPLTPDQIPYMYVDREDIPGNLSISIHCDTAFKSRDKMGRGDYNVIQVWGHTRDGSGEVYYLDGFRSNTWRIEDFGDKLVQVIQKLKKEGKRPFCITDEQAIAGKADVFDNLVHGWCAAAGMYSPPVMLLSRAGTKKETRIREAAAYWADGKVHLVRDAEGVKDLVSEMLRIGVSAHDDMADAAADVFHPEIYIPERAFARDPQPTPIRRPMDDLLQLPPTMWTADDWRASYDSLVEEEMEQMGWDQVSF